MKIIIEIPEEMHERIKDGYVPLGISKYLKNGTPYEERPHGEWIKKDTYFGKCWATCSVCKKISDGTGKDNGFGHDYSYPNFCPKCGADMRKEGDGK